MSAAHPVYCGDWGCPAQVSCARHFGRSRAYAALDVRAKVSYRSAREPGANSCPDYRFDRPRRWLAIDPAAPIFHLAGGHGGG